VLHATQERLGLELTSLIEDPQSASVRMIAAEAHAIQASGPASGSVSPSEPWSTWIAPSPVSVKLRLFCLPYAGGVSENVFARYYRPQRARWQSRCSRLCWIWS